MAHEPVKWASGLIPLVLLGLATVATKTASVEADLGEKAAKALGTELGDGLAAKPHGRDIKLGGKTFTVDGMREAVERIEAIPGVRLVYGEKLDVIDKVDPYEWSAERVADRVTLSGVAPNLNVRSALVQAAKDLGAVNDSLGYARGAGADFQPQALFALRALSYLASGKASLRDNALTLVGVAANASSYDQALALLQSPPAGLNVAKVEIAAPAAKPFVFSAAKTASRLTLSGFAPSYGARDAAFATAKLTASGPVDGGLVVASGAPGGDYGLATAYALSELSFLAEGKARLSDNALSLVGVAASSKAYEQALAGLKSPPEGVTVAVAAVTPPVAKPFVFAVVSTGGAPHLSGAAPSLPAREAILAAAAAAFPDKIVDSALDIAAGAPAGDFVAAAVLIVRAVASLDEGQGRLVDSQLVFAGKERKPGDAEALVLAARRAAPGFAIDVNGVTPFVYTLDNFKLAATALAAGAPALDAAACGKALRAELARGKVEFDAESEIVARKSYATLASLAGVALRCNVGSIQVAGYADNPGEAAATPRLSQQRAEVVRDLLVKAGVPPTRVSAIGRGAAEASAANDNDDGRAKSRLIEFVVK